MKILRTWVPLSVAAALWMPLTSSLGAASATVSAAASATIVISEFRVRGPNGGNDEFIELHNLSSNSVPIGGWTIRGSNSTGFVSVRTTIPADVALGPGCFYLVANTAAAGYSDGVLPDRTYGTGVTDDGGIAVAMPDGSIVDQVGLSSGSVYKETTPLASLGSSNLNRSYERKPGGNAGHVDTDNNAADFQLISPSAPRNLSSPCIGNELRVQGAAAPNPVPQFDNALIIATVAPGKNPASTGLSVVADLTALDAGTQPLYDDGTNGDQTAGDHRFSYLLNIASAPGSYSVTVNAMDAQARAASHSFMLQVAPPPVVYLPHDVQGVKSISPFVGASVTVEGVVTGIRSNGFFIQTAPGDEDDDAATSEGLFVFTGSAPDESITVGTLLRATGNVVEYSGDGHGLTLTELSNPSISIRGTAPVPTPMPLTAAVLKADGGVNQLEPLESMLVSVASLTTTSGTDGSFFSTTGGEASGVMNSNGAFFAVLTGTERPVREPGLDLQIASTFSSQCAAGPPCSIPVFDANPERLRVDSDALGAPRLDVTSGVVISGMTGIVESGFLAWGLLPTLAAPGVATSNLAGIPVQPATATQFTAASFNMQRFFDTVNDAGISDVALTAANYNARLAKASLIIRTALHMPDILGVQEVENLDVLQAIAERVNADAGIPGEYTAYLADGNDPGGIDVGFMVRSRVNVTSVTQEGKDVILINPLTGQPYTNSDGTPQLLNDRPPLVLRATVNGPAHRLNAEIIVVANHLRSLGGVEEEAPRVRHKRQQQAEFLAVLLDELQEEGRVVSLGDYNAFEFSDGLVDVMGTVVGDPTAGAHVVLASTDLTDPDFLFTAPGVYSYVFEGNAQTLDHVIVSQGATDLYAGLQHARINADFPEVYRNDAARIERLSDHDPAVAYFEFPRDTQAPAVSITPSVTSLSPANHQMVHVGIEINATDNLAIASCGVSAVSSSEPANAAADGSTEIDWVIDGPSAVRLRAERAGAATGRVYTITVECVDVAGNVGTATTGVTVPHDRGQY